MLAYLTEWGSGRKTRTDFFHSWRVHYMERVISIGECFHTHFNAFDATNWISSKLYLNLQKFDLFPSNAKVNLCMKIMNRQSVDTSKLLLLLHNKFSIICCKILLTSSFCNFFSHLSTKNSFNFQWFVKQLIQ